MSRLIADHERTFLREILELEALARFLTVSGPPEPAPPVRKRPREGRPYLHPTKGWRGDRTFPRGTNKRRIRRAHA